MALEGHFPARVSEPAYKKVVRIIEEKGYILGPQVSEQFGKHGSSATSYNLNFDVTSGRFKERTGRDVEIHFLGMNVVIFAGLEQSVRDTILQRAAADIRERKANQNAERAAVRARNRQ